MAACTTATDESMGHKACDVHIQSTMILKAVVEELGGTQPIYENVSWYISPVEFQVTFNIPSKIGENGCTVRVAICGLMPEGTSREDACEAVARDALDLLQHEHGISVVDYNWMSAAELRGRCAALADKFKDNKYICDFLLSKSFMVADGIEFASDVFLNKAFEVDNATDKIAAPVDMAAVYRDCAIDLSSISRRLRLELAYHDGLTKMLQKMSRALLQRPYIEYTELFLKVGSFKAISGLSVVLEEVASKAGFETPVITTEKHGGCFMGKVQLHHLASGSKTKFESSILTDKREAICTVIQLAIGFVSGRYGLNILDPNYYACTELRSIEKAIRSELVHLAKGAMAAEDRACESINDIHILGDRYDGSISDKDAEIKGLLIAVCVDLSHHLDLACNLRKDAIENSKF